MLFVDGENLTIRAQELAVTRGVELTAGPHWRRDVFVWLPDVTFATQLSSRIAFGTAWDDFSRSGVRAYYYTSLTGDDSAIAEVREQLWTLGFDPSVFKKASRTRRSKAVDISLATDMLSHAFSDHFDGVILIAGDGDYVPLVEAVKRQGKLVQVVFFRSVVSEALRLSADWYSDWTGPFFESWEARESNDAGKRARQ